ncbi:MAG: hypothetical protein ACREJC_16600 [Tepidisphaeraceae bacterium]
MPNNKKTEEPANLKRARLAIALPKGTVYSLGAGGQNPEAPNPWNDPKTRQCDCSGFVAWANGYKRGNFNTDGIVRDVGGIRSRYAWVWYPSPGAVVVYRGKPAPLGR